VSGFGRGKEAVPFKLDDVVQYRPDLVAQRLDYAPVVRPNTPVSFAAVVAERMGDVGAHADCVLLVDGAQVDGARIWVDASSVVTCRFAYNFTTTGTHSVAARVQNITPGDFDPSNNQVSGSIVVENPAQIFYSVTVHEETDNMNSIIDTYASGASTVPDQHVAMPMTLAFQSRHFSGSIPSAVKLPLAALSYSDSSDGKALNSLSYTNVNADAGCLSDDPNFTTEHIVMRYDDASAGWLTLRVYQNDTTGAGKTTIEGGWDAGDVTYVTEGYCKSVGTTFQCAGGDWTQNDPASFASGAMATLGSSYAANIVVDDGTSYTGKPNMVLNTTHTSVPMMTSCFPVDFGGATPGQSCYSFASDTVARDGQDSHLQ
jgi:hypothetical protein